MTPQSINVTINGTGFAADYTARTYGMIPHKNGVSIRLAGVTSGRMENAERFAAQHQIERAYLLCLEGVRNCPPEDVGGVWGYRDFLGALFDSDHGEHEDYKEWAGNFYPGEFSVAEATNAMRRGLPDWLH